MREVVYAFPVSHRFRAPFHEGLRDRLAREGVRYRYLYSAAQTNQGKGDTCAIDWAEDRPCRTLPGGLLWHRIGQACARADLVIVQQENRLAANYPLILSRRRAGRRVAYFGHGRNFQSARPAGPAERWKAHWARQVDWWFAYTDGAARAVAETGFPETRITTFNNAIDQSAIARELAALDPQAQAALRRSMLGGSRNVAVYVGGLYAQKRLGFLLEALDLLRARLPDLQAIIIGAGPEEARMRAAAHTRPWLHVTGPLFGAEKTRLVALASVWLMPGLVGLAVLDSFAYGTPMVTTRLPYHSPEIAYLEPGRNGVIVEAAQDPAAYADAARRVMTDGHYREALIAGAATARASYTMEAMVDRFAVGVMSALDAAPRPAT